jgi:putative CocE/NonD family hydrolase
VGTLQEWVAHPYPDDYWDQYNPTSEQYAKLTLPILTITGSYDDDQPGALAHYKEYMRNTSAEGRARHYLIIGPWDHAGTRTPDAHVGGLTFGPASLVDLPKLHLEWFAWTMQGGPKPAFLEKPVAYYVMQADRWRYADSLDSVTASMQPYYLDSKQNATDVLEGGLLQPQAGSGAADHFLYDPRDTSLAQVEYGEDPSSLTDQRMVYAQRGHEVVYHTAPFDKDTEVSGFFKLSAWIAIDQPDVDLQARVFEIAPDGGSVALSSDLMRARYREGLREPKPVRTKGALRYDFERFTFVSRMIRKGSRLRLVISPVNSIFSEKNYNSEGVVAQETVRDARAVNVTLVHDRGHPSVLWVPVGQP